MRFISLGILLSSCCGLVAAEASHPLPAGVRRVADLAYVPDGKPAQRLDLYLPDKPSERPLPVIVWIHGGGWNGGDKNGCPPLRWVPQGYIAASVEYRFSRDALFPAQIQDCQAAIRWLRAHAAEYGIDPEHIGVWGESAGGHLVTLLGTAGGTNAFPKIGGNDAQSDRVQAVCDYYGPADFNTVVAQAASDREVQSGYRFNEGDPYSQLIGVPLGSDRAKSDAVSPIHYVSADDPPILILHGTKDPLVPYAQSVELVGALKAAGVKNVLLQTLPGAGHGGDKFYQRVVIEQVRTFFDQHLKGAQLTVPTLSPASMGLEPTTAPSTTQKSTQK